MTGGNLLFSTSVSLLVLHEMDAIDKKEWRLLFVIWVIAGPSSLGQLGNA